MKSKIVFIMCLHCIVVDVFSEKENKVWQQDMSNDMKIGPAESGYKRVSLKCLDYEKIMQVHIEMEEKFDGVIYTRGNFYSRESGCFLKPKPGRKFKMRIPFDRCNTTKAGDLYKNIIVIQYDDELIMPGDAAFALECDLGPKEVKVNAKMGTLDENSIRYPESRISLADADPAGKPLPKHKQSTVIGTKGSVTFTPDDVRPRRKKKKDEL